MARKRLSDQYAQRSRLMNTLAAETFPDHTNLAFDGNDLSFPV